MQISSIVLPNIAAVLVTLFVFSYMAWKSVEAFRSWQFRPLLFIASGMLLLGVSSLWDLMFRYSSGTVDQLAMEVSMRGSALLFYLGAFLVVRGIMGGQARVRWDHLIVYAMIYGGMCVLYLLPGHVFVVYDSLNSMWFVTSDTALFVVLNSLTALPGLDILSIVAQREKSAGISPKVRRSLNLLYVGIITAFLGSFIIFVLPNQYGAVLSNVSLAISVGLVIFAFTRHPLFLSFSHATPHRIILVSSKDTSMALAYYDWTEDSFVTAELTSAAICGTSMLIDEITRPADRKENLRHVKLESREVIIERTNDFACYLVVENSDRLCSAGLRRVVLYYQEKYGDKDIEVHKALPHDEFHDIIEGTFIFCKNIAEKEPL